jgi:hypothetical protein
MELAYMSQSKTLAARRALIIALTVSAAIQIYNFVRYRMGPMLSVAISMFPWRLLPDT